MEFEPTQVYDDGRTGERSNDTEDKQIGTLCIEKQEFKIMEGLNRIGRAPMCRVVLDDSTVSKVHAEIQAGSEATFITDLRSTNGTTLKNLSLRQFFFYPLQDGDVVVFGKVKAVYRILKKLSEDNIDLLTPKASNVATRPCSSASRKSASVLGSDCSLDGPNDSVVPGSQIINKKRLFRQPEPLANCIKNKVRTSDIIEKPEKRGGSEKSINENDSTDMCELETQQMELLRKRSRKDVILQSTRNTDVCGDIHEMETQDITDPHRIIVESSSCGIQAEKSKTDNLQDIHEMETQDILNTGSLSSRIPKEPRCQRSPDVFSDHTDENIYEAETQVAIKEPVEKLGISATVDPNDSSTDDEGVFRRKSPRKGCQMIAETDDDLSKSDEEKEAKKLTESCKKDDLSDESITDDERVFGNSALKVTRKEQQGKSPLPITIQSAKRPEENIYDAPTQQMKDYSLRQKNGRATTSRSINEEPDFDLLPTQVLDVATSTPVSRRWRNQDDDFDESLVMVTEDQDIYNAVTQVVPEKSESVVDSSSKIPSSTRKNEERKESEDEEDTSMHLDDTIDQNLGNIFGQEVTRKADSMDEPTQLMTQNLVDILKPTQNIIREEAKSSSKEDKKCKEATIAERKRNESAGTLGFVDGLAIASKDQFLCTPTSTSAEKNATRVEGSDKQQPKASASGGLPLSERLEDDDIFFGLPEVRISGTFSNPGSPTSSEGSSDSDSVSVNVEKCNKPNREPVIETATSSGISNSSKPLKDSRSKVDETREPDSPVLSTKSRVKGRYVTRKCIEDDDRDSDDDLDYNDLKRMADKLLASTETTNDTNVRKIGESGGLRVEKKIVAKTNSIGNRRPTRNLSKTSSSLTVTGVDNTDRSVDGNDNRVVERSVRGSRKRPRQSAKNESAEEKIVSKKKSTDSHKIGNVKEKQQLAALIPSKTYAKVQLTRLNENGIRTKENNSEPITNIESPKEMRTRRSTPTSTKESLSSPNSEARVRNRRTIGPVSSLVNQRHKILFTGIKNEDYERIVTQLGGSVVSEPSKATVLITDKVRRTFKFLCAVAQGTKVVSIKWLTESNNVGHFLDCDNFILHDPLAEEKFRFKLADSLRTARTKKLLDGYTIIVTPKVNQPEISEIKGMVEACGGRVLVRAGRSWDSKTVIVSREDDLAAAKALLSKSPKAFKITVQSTEFLLTGILRQEVNFVDHKLL